MRKFLLIFSIFFFSLFLLFIFNPAQNQASPATGNCQAHNVFGWAWSGNIGWISFSCKNCDTTPRPAGCPTGNIPDYGVDIDSSGYLRGYAWSSNIGWIRFDPPGPYPTAPNYSVCIDFPGRTTEPCNGIGEYNIAGWARALAGGTAEAGGWDGWIKLRGSIQGGGSYGPRIDLSLGGPPYEIRGWAWGGDGVQEQAVVGWISFNCRDRNICSQSNYKVLTSFSLNRPPVATISCCPNGCANPPGACTGFRGVFCLRNDSTDPDGNLQNSIWRINGNTFNCQTTGNPTCNLTPDLPTNPSVPINYNAQLEVIDSEGLSATTTVSFTLLQDIVADFKCSLDQNGPWQECNGFKVTIGETVYFRDESVASTGARINSWSWVFPDSNPATSNQQNPSTQFQSSGGKQVTLTVIDSAGRSDSETKTLNVRRLPIWIPIPPR